ncbi:hypothetical protein [Pectobacterium brasiliense]|uniref:hypothetical protein n=1 Tax=Pectobacterium brasiliense TaxID=180957 RepID=UPI000CE699B9|nr:hypothetical protein [Pectobacterium brasiliense]PPE57086.1 hypothetical protein F152LOC_04134 [Pectobacterium brasiliense]
MKYVIAALPLLLVGCAKVSDYQAGCEQRYSKLSDMATCLDISIKNDSRMATAPTPKMYVLAAKFLGQKVDSGEITDMQARMELQNLYINMQRQEQADQVAQSQALQQALLNAQTVNTLQSIEQKNRQPVYIPPVPLQNNNITTNCTTYGNQTRCQSY